jgi:acyl carrier protein
MESVVIGQIKSQLREIIIKDLDANIGAKDISDEVSLYEDGIGLDSISIVHFIVQIESKFKINFDQEDINPDLFGSINNLANFINTKIN